MTNINGKSSDVPETLPPPAQSAAKFEKYVDQAASTAHNSIDKISGAAHPVVDHVTSTVHSAIDSLCETATHTADLIGKNTVLLKDVQARSMASVRTHVRDSPLIAIGMAAALGYLVARIIKSR